MSNKKLILIFGGLLVLYLLSRVFMGNRESTFDPNVITIDTSAITEIHLFPKAENNAEIVLKKSGDNWTASMNGKTIQTPTAKLQGLIGQLAQIRSQRVVSRARDKWGEYEVNEQGSRVTVMGGGKKLADFVVGTFKFDQAKRSASSYVRKSDADDVHLVDGFLSMTFNQAFDAFRNNELIKLNKEDIREVAVRENGEKIAISKNPEDGAWYRGGMEKLDSAKAAQYITQLTNVYGSDYASEEATGNPIKTLEISGNNLTTPLTVDCYMRADTSKPFVFHSSSNPETWFTADSTGLYQRLFVKFDELLNPVPEAAN